MTSHGRPQTWKEIIWEYTSRTTLHGLPYLSPGKGHLVPRYPIFNITMLYALLVIITEIFIVCDDSITYISMLLMIYDIDRSYIFLVEIISCVLLKVESSTIEFSWYFIFANRNNVSHLATYFLLEIRWRPCISYVQTSSNFVHKIYYIHNIHEFTTSLNSCYVVSSKRVVTTPLFLCGNLT